MPKFTKKLENAIHKVYDSASLKAFEGKTLLFAINNGNGDEWDLSDSETHFRTRPNKNAAWQNQRIGRLIKSIYPQVLDSRVEIMVNSVKTIVGYEKSKKNFKIIDGNKIHKYYKTKNYAKPIEHHLYGSCMNDVDKARFKWHKDNADRVKLLVYMDPEQKGKIQARAYLFTKCWFRVGDSATERNKDENKIWGKMLDRVYGNSDYYNNLMKMYADEKGWFVRTEQSMKFTYKSEPVTARIKITIPHTENWANHAYSDTLNYLSESGTLSNKRWKTNVEYETIEEDFLDLDDDHEEPFENDVTEF